MESSGYCVTSDQHKVHYDQHRSGHNKVIIIAHGFFNSKQSVLLNDLVMSVSDEYDVIVFDFRGHGKSSGLFYWTSREYKDLLAVLDYAHLQYIKIGVMGFSLGGSTSIITATKTKYIDSLVLVSAPCELEKVEYRLWELDPENDLWFGLLKEGGKGKGVRPGPFWHKKEKPIDVIDKITAPVLYIHGDRDWVVKEWHSQELHRKTKSLKDLVIIKNGPHAEYLIRKFKDKIVQLTKKWFHSTMS